MLLITDLTAAKLAVHGITPDEVRQVNDGDRIVLRNPRPRVESSYQSCSSALHTAVEC